MACRKFQQGNGRYFRGLDGEMAVAARKGQTGEARCRDGNACFHWLFATRRGVARGCVRQWKAIAAVLAHNGTMLLIFAAGLTGPFRFGLNRHNFATGMLRRSLKADEVGNRRLRRRQKLANRNRPGALRTKLKACRTVGQTLALFPYLRSD